ncbi:MAG: hypothetical protein ACXWMX_00015 [Candidatus Limnocylindrales bacterium]
MAVRLQMKLGVVAETDRLPDSPDTLVAVEPAIVSTSRSKGNLYLLVTGVGGKRLREATRQVAETIRGEYYYDESAGIAVCLEKAIRSANKRLGHGRDRLGVGRGTTSGPVGIALAVIRGGELYVITVGPAEAYLVRQARLLTLPDPHREQGLPAAELEPEVWRGEIAVGDSLLLVSANMTARLPADELKDALVTLHPQSATDHLHHRFVAEGGTGSDGAIALEATEVAATQKQRKLVPVWPAEPLAGTPERSPIPLADQVTDGVAAVQASAGRARSAAGGLLVAAVDRMFELMPRRGQHYRRVTTLSTRREGQRRASLALLAFVVVVGALGLALFALSGRNEGKIDAVTAGQRALEAARNDVQQVFGTTDLLTTDRPKATRLLTDAYQQLKTAQQTGLGAAAVDPLRRQVLGGLDRIYGVVPVAPTVAFAFPASTPPVDLGGLIQGPDGFPYVLDRASKTVYRVDIQAGKATPVLRAGHQAAGTTVGEPWLLAMGGPDLLILDKKDQLWRWRPADKKGAGTLTRVTVSEASGWGTDIRALGTYVRSADEGLYNLYVVDPSARQILRYSPAADGSGFPAASSGYLATAQNVSDIDALLIDGDVYVTEQGVLKRFVGGQLGSWSADTPGDELLRPAPHYSFIASPSARGTGELYGYDAGSARVVAIDKADGSYKEQYRLAGGDQHWRDLRGMYVVKRLNGLSPVLVWIDRSRVMTAPLEAVPDNGSALPGSPNPSSSAAAPRASGLVPSGRASPAASR